MTYIKHSHKAEASRGVQGGLLAVGTFSVTGEGSRHASAFGLGAELSGPWASRGSKLQKALDSESSPVTNTAPLHNSD